jgi:hypothetical protein
VEQNDEEEDDDKESEREREKKEQRKLSGRETILPPSLSPLQNQLRERWLIISPSRRREIRIARRGTG